MKEPARLLDEAAPELSELAQLLHDAAPPEPSAAQLADVRARLRRTAAAPSALGLKLGVAGLVALALVGLSLIGLSLIGPRTGPSPREMDSAPAPVPTSDLSSSIEPTTRAAVAPADSSERLRVDLVTTQLDTDQSPSARAERAATAERAAPAERAASAVRATSPSSAAVPDVAVVDAEAPEATPAPVIDEAELLARANGMLRAGDPSAALALLAEHERLPSPMLVQERERIAIEALARAGRASDAEARARAFITRFPDSSYRSRVESLVGRSISSEEPPGDLNEE